jgi:transposase
VALEAGADSGWISRLLAGIGHEALVANARELRKIHQSDRKNDRADAQIVARHARVDPQLLAPIRHRSAAMQADLAVVRARDALLTARTKCINAARGLVKPFGARLPTCSARSVSERLLEHAPAELRPALEPLLATIAELTAQIRRCDRQIEELAAQRYPESALLRQVTGVGALTAVTFVLTLADRTRFTKSRDVGAYLGLVPRQDDSGERSPQLRITKAGNTHLRRLLVNCARTTSSRRSGPTPTCAATASG